MEMKKTILKDEQGNPILVGREQIENLKDLDSRLYLDLSQELGVNNTLDELVVRLRELGYLFNDQEKIKLFLKVNGFTFENLSIKLDNEDYYVLSIVESDEVKIYKGIIGRADTIQEFINKHRVVITTENLNQNVDFSQVRKEITIVEDRTEKLEIMDGRTFVDLSSDINVYANTMGDVINKIKELGYDFSNRFYLKMSGNEYLDDIKFASAGDVYIAVSTHNSVSYFNGQIDLEQGIYSFIQSSHHKFATESGSGDDLPVIIDLKSIEDGVYISENTLKDFYIHISGYCYIGNRILIKGVIEAGNRGTFLVINCLESNGVAEDNGDNYDLLLHFKFIGDYRYLVEYNYGSTNDVLILKPEYVETGSYNYKGDRRDLKEISVLMEQGQANNIGNFNEDLKLIIYK